MLQELPKRFFHSGSCPCSPCGPQTGNATPVYPSAGARVSDDKYFALATAPQGQMLVVPAGSNTQAFLRGAAGARGIVFYENNEVAIQPSPSLTLPLLNPAVSGSFPAPGPWKYVTVGTGADPAGWRHVAAPTTGAFVLQAKNGEWILADAGSIPGINEIGNSSATTTKGGLMMLVESSPGSWVVRRLAVQHGRVVVGDVDEVTGLQGYKNLSLAAALVHPIGKFQNLRFSQAIGLDQNGAEIAGGFEQAVPTGVGAVTDGVRLIYSPGSKRLYKQPAQTIRFLKVATPSASQVAPAAYAVMPAGHGAGAALTYNYPTVRLEFMASLNAVETLAFGFFKDGVLIQEFAISSTLDPHIFFIDEAVTPGVHTYDVRWKKIAGASASIIQLSTFLVSTLGY